MTASPAVRWVVLAVLLLVTVGCLAAVATVVATRAAGDGIGERLQSLRDDAPPNRPEADEREQLLALAREFVTRFNTYGPDLLDDQGTMPDYAAVADLMTARFADVFTENVGYAEETVKQLGASREATVWGVGVATHDVDSAQVLVAGTVELSYPAPDPGAGDDDATGDDERGDGGGAAAHLGAPAVPLRGVAGPGRGPVARRRPRRRRRRAPAVLPALDPGAGTAGRQRRTHPVQPGEPVQPLQPLEPCEPLERGDDTVSPNLYDLLDVPEDATTDEIRAAWKAAIADLEPTDRRFRAFNDAAAVLLDADRRAAYDAELAAARAEEEPADDADGAPQVDLTKPAPAVDDDGAPRRAGRPGPGARRPPRRRARPPARRRACRASAPVRPTEVGAGGRRRRRRGRPRPPRGGVVVAGQPRGGLAGGPGGAGRGRGGGRPAGRGRGRGGRPRGVLLRLPHARRGPRAGAAAPDRRLRRAAVGAPRRHPRAGRGRAGGRDRGRLRHRADPGRPSR
ncbi:J domain-containing protein [Nocardioides sp. TF02-7]|uniref:J domain-containing protein n=1 Tax=Nocardioides sp. TF02-7 TaxID=2917724 RepID=UPI001F050D05|nr:J domain-containing protein [Nocardioides sp. TF02-7]UMG93778.1 J domain-containing protein [Nocardioides sp. TF02-7]